MIVMFIDHCRERFFSNIPMSDPMDIDLTEPSFFFTRITTHLCAPIFVFLTGISAWLYAHPNNKSPRSASSFLFKRGLFLIFLEITLINFSWFGAYQTLYLQVIWAIGISMIILSFLCSFPSKILFLIGFIIVFGHNLLTPIEFNHDEFGYSIWTILHDRGYLMENSFINIKASYPVLPWIGLILLGYVSGSIYKSSVNFEQRSKLLIKLSLICFISLFIFRGFNIYGESLPWTIQSTPIKTVMSFMNFTKYPPSLNFMQYTIGIAFFLLWFFEKYNYKWMTYLKTLGSAPMFFYIIHLYFLLITFKLLKYLNILNDHNEYSFEHYYQLLIIVILFIIILYYPTKIFSDFKRKSSSKLIKYF